MRSLIAVLVLAWAAEAHAGGIVLESYAGPRPTDAGDIVGPLVTELGTRGFVGGYGVVGAKFEAEVSRPAVQLQGLPLDFGDQVDKGHKAWIAGRFEEAVRILTPLVDLAHANPGAIIDVSDHVQRDRLQKAMTALAISQQRMGEAPSAKATFGELLRSFPDATVSRSNYGAEAAQAFEDVKRDLAAAGRGRLIVNTGDATALVFLDEHAQTVGNLNKGDLYAGEYRVLVQVGPMLSRSHRAVVRPGEDTTIDIDLAFDQAIHTAKTWTGMTFASSGEREKLEGTYASRFAKALGASAVAVVGIDESRGKPALVGSLIGIPNQRETRRAGIALDPPPPSERVRALARFLGGDAAEKGIDVMEGRPVVEAPVVKVTHRDAPPPPPASATWGGWKWITGVAAAGALVTGGVLLHYDGQCSENPGCGNVYNLAAPGWIAIGGGAALAVVTVYLAVHGRGSYVAPAPGGGAMVGWATAF